MRCLEFGMHDLDLMSQFDLGISLVSALPTVVDFFFDALISVACSGVSILLGNFYEVSIFFSFGLVEFVT